MKKKKGGGQEEGEIRTSGGEVGKRQHWKSLGVGPG